MRARQGLRQGVHPPGVERGGNVPGPPFFQRPALRRVEDAVFVPFAACVVPRMERRRHLYGMQYGDIRRQMSVERRGQPLRGNTAGRVERAAEAAGVYARIGAAATGQGRAAAGAGLDGVLYPGLDRYSVFLYLPSVIAGTAELQEQQDSLHTALLTAPPVQITAGRNTFRQIVPAISAAPVRKHSRSLACRCGCFMRVRPSPPW